jgi:integrase
LYDSKGYFDNYVGLVIKELRCFFNYIEMERRIPIGSYHKSFFVPKEEIPIIALSVEQLNYIIYDEAYNALLKQKKREEIRDVFVFGCTVALRISDLLQLTVKNLVVQNNNYYLRVKSQKTATMTSIKLPDYAVALIKKYEGKYATLLPEMTPQWFNSQLKSFARMIPDNYEMIKVRERRGKQVVIYKDPIKKTHYQLSDHITSHTMRRTAITVMLNLGMPEHIVRKISGHAVNSREFYRYVQLTQQVIDVESEKVFEKIKYINQSMTRKRVRKNTPTTSK